VRWSPAGPHQFSGGITCSPPINNALTPTSNAFKPDLLQSSNHIRFSQMQSVFNWSPVSHVNWQGHMLDLMIFLWVFHMLPS